jgi:hypothetical protein
MKLFVWEDVTPVSDRYHNGGGLVVIAEDLKAARKLYAKELEKIGRDSYSEEPILIAKKDEKHSALKITPSYIGEMRGDNVARVFTFPDAGCC